VTVATFHDGADQNRRVWDAVGEAPAEAENLASAQRPPGPPGL